MLCCTTTAASASSSAANSVVVEQRSLSDPPSWGVSLQYLKSLKVRPEASFNDACALVKKMTNNTQGDRSLAGFLLKNAKTKKYVKAHADVFVSYAWSGGWGPTMNALVSEFKEKDVFVWMDFAVVDQHVAAETNIEFSQWAAIFKESLKRIGKAVLVLSPGEKPIATTRAWCCFEWATISQADIPFTYCIDPKDVRDLISKMRSGAGFALFNDIFSGINVERAVAFKPSDQEAILRLIRDIGVVKVNDIVMLSVKNWLLQVCSAAQTEATGKSEETTNIVNAKGALHNALGEYDEAFGYYERAVKLAQETPENERKIAAQINNLAVALKNKGKYAEAQKLAEGSLEIFKKILGEDHPNVAITLNNLGLILSVQGKYAEAESLCRKAIAIGEKSLGRENTDVAAWYNNLAEYLMKQNNVAEARKAHEESLAIKRKVVGNDHPSVATSLNNLALLLESQGELNEAESAYRESIGIFKKTLGVDHPNVATLLNNFAALLTKQGKLKEAEESHREALAIRKKKLGNSHADVAASLNNLAIVLKMEGGKQDEAKALGREAVLLWKQTLGANHPITQQGVAEWGA